MPPETVLDVKFSHMEKELDEIKDSVKSINCTLANHGDTLARIETSLLIQQGTCESRGKQQDKNTTAISDLKIVDGKQEIKNENFSTTMQEFKNFTAKWGPFLSIMAFIFYNKFN